jgi:hypothetical protein
MRAATSINVAADTTDELEGRRYREVPFREREPCAKRSGIILNTCDADVFSERGEEREKKNRESGHAIRDRAVAWRVQGCVATAGGVVAG